MAKKVSYNQCKLVRKTTGQVAHLLYIPEQYAIQGEYVKLKGEDDVWVDGWQVMSVGEERVIRCPKIPLVRMKSDWKIGIKSLIEKKA